MRKIQQSFMYLPTVLFMIVIFCFSAQPAEESSAESSRIVNLVLQGVESLRGFEFSSEEFAIYAEKIHTPIRKLAHMTEYALLAWTILIPTLYLKRERWWKKKEKTEQMLWKFLDKKVIIKICFGSIFITMLYASTDEFHQLFVEGRSGKVMDVLIDTCGAMLGSFAFLLLWRIFLAIKGKFKKLKIS